MTNVPQGFARAKALDRSRDDLAALLRISPGSVYNRLATARALHRGDEVDDAGRDEADADADGDSAEGPAGDAGADDADGADEVDGPGGGGDAAGDVPVDLAGLVDQGLLFGPGLRSVTAAASHLPAAGRQPKDVSVIAGTGLITPSL